MWSAVSDIVVTAPTVTVGPYRTNTTGVGVNQAYSRFSTTHGHITDCRLDSVVHAVVCV